MAYTSVPNTRLTLEQSKRGWQVRVAVDPHALIESNVASSPNRHIETINQILAGLQHKYTVDAQLYTFDSEEDMYAQAYNTNVEPTSYQRGKEIRIFLPDAKHKPVENYNLMLLELWSELQRHNIPLIYKHNYSDEKILGNNGLPTPFSLTNIISKQKSDTTHGALFHKFVRYYDHHPILQLSLASEDLAKYNLSINVADIAKRNRAEYLHARDKSINDITLIIRLIHAEHTDQRIYNRETTKILQELEADYLSHSSAHMPGVTYIDWAEYIPDYNLSSLRQLIYKNPIQMKKLYTQIVLLEQEKISYHSFQSQCKRYALHSNFNDPKAYEELARFDRKIRRMEYHFYNKQHAISEEVLNSFKKLYDQLQHDMINHKKCDLKKTPYLAVIDHFANLADEVNRGNKFTSDEVNNTVAYFNKTIQNKPMNKVLKLAICAVLGALFGAVIGFAIGAVATFFAGGIAGVPGAIYGGILGATFASSLAGAGATGVGLFDSQKKHSAYQERQSDLHKLTNNVTHAHTSLMSL